MANTPIHVKGSEDFSFVLDDDIGIDSEVLLSGNIRHPLDIVIQKPGGEECKNCTRVNIPKKVTFSGSEICLKIPSVAEVSSGTLPMGHISYKSFGNLEQEFDCQRR